MIWGEGSIFDTTSYFPKLPAPCLLEFHLLTLHVA